MIRKLNGALGALIIALLLIHMIGGAFQLTGLMPGGSQTLKVITWATLALIGLHAVLSVWLTLPGLRSRPRYFRVNALYWTRRLTGLALVILLAAHTFIFMGESGESFRLRLFEGPQLAGQLLMVLCAAVHILANLDPLRIGFGVTGKKAFARDALAILGIVLLFCAAAFVVYYFRWNISWKKI